MSDNCRGVRQLLGAYADGELGQPQRELVEKHLTDCAECRKELERIEALHQLVKSVEHPSPAEDYWDWHRVKVWRGIRDQRRELVKTRRQVFPFGRFAGVAAGLAVILVIVVSGWRMLGVHDLPGIGKDLVAEKAAKPRPEAVAAEPESGSTEARAAEPGREVQPADGIESGARKGSGTGVTTAGRGGAAGQPPVASTLRESDEGMAVAGLKDREDASKPVRQQTRAAEQPARTGVAGKVAAPPPPVVAKEEDVVRFSQVVPVDAEPELVSAPALPDVSESDTGTVTLKLTIDSLGTVVRAVVARSSGHSLSDSIAVLNARASRFRPAVRGGRQLGAVLQRQYRFKAAVKKSEQKGDKPTREHPRQDRSEQDKPQPGKPIRSGE